jgi:hypothetical protein
MPDKLKDKMAQLKEENEALWEQLCLAHEYADRVENGTVTRIGTPGSTPGPAGYVHYFTRDYDGPAWHNVKKPVPRKAVRLPLLKTKPPTTEMSSSFSYREIGLYCSYEPAGAYSWREVQAIYSKEDKDLAETVTHQQDEVTYEDYDGNEKSCTAKTFAQWVRGRS